MAAALTELAKQQASLLKEKGIVPTLAILRVGERSDDLSYERGAVKRCEAAGIRVVREVLPREVDPHSFFGSLTKLNQDPDVHGILMFRPLPPQLDEKKARHILDPAKDVDRRFPRRGLHRHWCRLSALHRPGCHGSTEILQH